MLTTNGTRLNVDLCALNKEDHSGANDQTAPTTPRHSLVMSLINSAIEVWFASEPLAACMWGSWDTNCLISPTVLALCLS